MIIGLTIQNYKNIKPSLYTKIVLKMGIDHIEYDPSIFFDLNDILLLIKNTKKKSVILHSPYYSDWGYDLSSKQQHDKIEKFLQNLNEFYKELRIKAVVVHPPKDPNSDEKFFLQNINQIPVTVLLENLPGQSWKNFENWYFSIKNMAKSKIKVCFDIPHSYLANGKSHIFDIPEKILNEIVYIHISELDGISDCHWPFYTAGGSLPIDKFKDFLKQTQFSGIINMEMRPINKVDMINLVRSFLLLHRLTNKRIYVQKLFRLGINLIPILYFLMKNKLF